jgi:hypothetical protein
VDLTKIRDEAADACRASGFTEDAYPNIVVRDVVNGLAVDRFIPSIISQRDEQIKKYM